MKNRLLAILLLLSYVSLTSPSMGDATHTLTEWGVPPGQQPCGIEVVSDRIWYASITGAIGTLSPATNTFTEWQVSGVAEYPQFLEILGSRVFFTDQFGDHICILDLNTDKVGSIPIPTDDGGPFGLSLSPSSSPKYVVFTESQAAKIGRLDLGEILYIPVDAPRSSMTSTPTFNNIVPEVNVVTPTITTPHPIPFFPASTPPTVTGSFTEWSVPSDMIEDWGPIMIVSDDTTVSYWFTTRKNSLGRLVPDDDKIYPLTLPTSSARTMDLKLDSLGNIWYTAGHYAQGKSADVIGKLELNTGTITEWIIPTNSAAPSSLDIDGSGMVWFTEQWASKIGRLDPSTNTFYEFPVSTGGEPLDIAVDSHGTVWFTESQTNKIGALSITGQTVTTTVQTQVTSSAAQTTSQVQTSIQTIQTETVTQTVGGDLFNMMRENSLPLIIIIATVIILGAAALTRKRKLTSPTQPQISTAYCTECGALLRPGRPFCPSCGKRQS